MTSLPPLRLYNTLTRSKEEFQPIDSKNVRLYVCGPTVYDLAHIGNARPLIVFDVLYRLLRHRYGAEHVTYVRNITDVDDKINARAAERGISIRDLTEETNRIFQEDVRALGCLEPTHQPRATEFVAKPDASIDMIRMISRLIETGHAYEADGHVLFSVPSMADYGRLSRRPLDEMIAGARVDVAPYKRADTDFVLWKPSCDGEPGWDSPWGFGRPGWHIECSAMSAALLGEVFDIHGGGIDLVFPHHENEIAQSRCCFGTSVMANVWMHNGFLQVEGEKMSKSLGNFVTIHDLLHTEKFGGRKWPGEVLRLAMLKTHYRQPIDWTVKALEEAGIVLQSWRDVVGPIRVKDLGRHVETPVEPKMLDALSDDLNTAEVFAMLAKLANAATKDEQARDELLRSLELLGLIPELAEARSKIRETASLLTRELNNVVSSQLTPILERALKFNEQMSFSIRKLIERYNNDQLLKHYSALQAAFAGFDTKKMLRLAERLKYADPELEFTADVIALIDSNELNADIERRLAARARKDWKESDRIRDELAAMGIALKDNKDGTTTWEVKR